MKKAAYKHLCAGYCVAITNNDQTMDFFKANKSIYSKQSGKGGMIKESSGAEAHASLAGLQPREGTRPWRVAGETTVPGFSEACCVSRGGTDLSELPAAALPQLAVPRGWGCEYHVSKMHSVSHMKCVNLSRSYGDGPGFHTQSPTSWSQTYWHDRSP